MAELRRLLIEQARLKESIPNSNSISLFTNEHHYLQRVLRLRFGEKLLVIDGIGNSWTATYLDNNFIKLDSDFDSPFLFNPLRYPLLGIAVAIPKSGFDDILRMTCEIGVDFIQPIFSDYSVLTKVSDVRLNRWDHILNEAVEQSERLWKPKLMMPLKFTDWLSSSKSNSLITLGTARSDQATPFDCILHRFGANKSQVWIAIGPEGGWTKNELKLAFENDLLKVRLASSILRTPTAAIVASQVMSAWKSKLS